MKQSHHRCVFSSICICIFSFLLSSCVTTTDSQFSQNADKEKAIQQYTQLGLRYIQQGNTVDAKRPLKRALEIDPNSPDVHNALAILFQQENDIELADKHFKIALKNGPSVTRIRNNYAAFLFGQKRYEQACVELERAGTDSLYEFRSRVFENLGVCYLQLKKTDAALISFEKAISIKDTQARAMLEAALIYFERDDFAKSENLHQQYQRLVRFKIAPNTSRNLWLGMQLAKVSGDKNKEASFRLMLKNMFPNSKEFNLKE